MLTAEQIKTDIISSIRKIELLLVDYQKIEPWTRQETDILDKLAFENNALFLKIKDYQFDHLEELGRACNLYDHLPTISKKVVKVEILISYIFTRLLAMQKRTMHTLFDDFDHEMYSVKLSEINKDKILSLNS